MMVDCANEHGVPEEIVRNFQPIPEDKKCWFKCIGIKMNIADEDGNIQPDKAKEFLIKMDAPKKALDAFDKCIGLKGDDPCSTAQAILMCFEKHEN